MVTTTSVSSVTINGTTKELKHMTAEDGVQLYELLGTLKGKTKIDYQELAQNVEQLALNFNTLIDIPLPDGITSFQDAISQALTEVKKGGAAFSDKAGLKDWWVKIKQAPGIGSLFGTMEGVAQTGSNIKDFGAGFIKPWSILFSPVDTLKNLASGPITLMKEGVNGLGGPMDPKAAKAFGAAYAAAVYAQTEGPAAPTQNKIPEPGIIDNIIAGATFCWEKITHFLPPAVTAFLPAVGKWFKNGFDWGKAWDEAKAEAEATHAQEAPSFDAIRDKHMAGKVSDKVRPQAADILKGAEDIAGYKTNELSQAIGQGLPYQDKNGTWNTLEFKDGIPEPKPLKDPDGNVLTSKQRTDNALTASYNAILPEGPLTTPKILGLGAGALTIGGGALGLSALATKFPRLGSAGAKAGGLLKKGTYFVDGTQGVWALAHGDLHGVAENAGQIAGAKFGSQYAALGAEKLLLRFTPGKYKALVGIAGMIGLFGGRKIGEYAGDKVGDFIAPKTEALEASLMAKQKEFLDLEADIQKQGINNGAVTPAQIPLLRTLPTTQEDQAKLLQDLIQKGVIPATLSQEQQLAALPKLQKMVQVQDALEKQPAAGTTQDQAKADAVDVTATAASTGLGIFNAITKLGPLASTSSKVATFIPGPVRTGLLALGDASDGLDAYQKGDSRRLNHDAARITGGVIGAIGGAAAAGAAIGACGGGLPAIPGAIIGGVVGAFGYYFGSKGAGALGDKAYDWINKDKEPATAANNTTAPSTPTQSPEMDPGLRQFMLAPQVKQQTRDVAVAMKKVYNVGMGTPVTSADGAPPVGAASSTRTPIGGAVTSPV